MSVVITGGQLRRFITGIFTGLGVRGDWAGIMGDSLAAANLRGVDSHGLQLVPFYVAQIEDGRVDPRAEGGVVSESGAVMNYGGANGLGQVVSTLCTDHAVRLAREHGLGLVVARESNHFGAAAWWAQRMAAAGMVGIVVCNASSMVAPWQGKDKRWGTNPICVAVPGGRWLLDMATTTVAMGKIYKANVNHEPGIPPGWAMDAEGAPTTSTAEALKGMLMPLGGYKGSGLAMMVEILAGVLGGGAMSTELGGFRVPGRPFRVSQFFLAIDVSRLMPQAEFEARMEKFTGMVKSSRPASGYSEVMVAGEPEWRAGERRLKEGVPLPEPLWEQVTGIAHRLGVVPPEAGVCPPCGAG